MNISPQIYWFSVRDLSPNMIVVIMLLVINRSNHGPPPPTHDAVSVHGYQFVYYKSFILISDRATGTRSLILTDSHIDFIKLLKYDYTPAVHKTQSLPPPKCIRRLLGEKWLNHVWLCFKFLSRFTLTFLDKNVIILIIVRCTKCIWDFCESQPRLCVRRQTRARALKMILSGFSFPNDIILLHLEIVSLSQHFRSKINGKLNYLQ